MLPDERITSNGVRNSWLTIDTNPFLCYMAFYGRYMFLIANLLATFNFEMISGAATKLSFGLILVASLLVNVFATSRMAAR